ncbi:hypothetical protein [Paenibacillus alvei]|uniref:hypothetical protein n=1 Tax=Paenibacillus alvei TaxID=44250 RepID=UPI00227ECB9B|nr:hypothetical protein [Paenibacillus alvei]
MKRRFRVKFSACSHCGADYPNGKPLICDETDLEKPHTCGNCKIGKIYPTDIANEICIRCGSILDNDQNQIKCSSCGFETQRTPNYYIGLD